MTTFCTDLISESNYEKLPGQISGGGFRISPPPQLHAYNKPWAQCIHLAAGWT